MPQLYKVILFMFMVSSTAFSQIDFDNVIIRKNISQQWELDSIDKQGTFRLVSYRPIYFAAARWSSKKNEAPFDESGEFATKDKNIFNNIEAKFQISFKTKVMQGVFFGTGDLWVGYTQKAHWQIYNKKLSRAFRELNYEPEIILNFPMDINVFKGKIRTFGVILNHQSNGKDIPTSRSWNRIVFNIGYEYNNWNINFRPWYRLPDTEDENPNITKYVGDAELEIGTHFGRHEFYTLINHSFSTFEKGNIQLNYVFPIHGHLRGHAQFFQGYGETLIDYNVSQTTLGIGVSFANW
ncbi:phospholipase A [Flavobacterium sp. PL002]|uniref:phospholipase A n=1 Tax=Flavobacterium sp. PL002 TaxID=1897058 RepID=UPI0017883D4C|nr:phospholipase A [Flavobacterium sp. PL002]MBE0392989.1 putative phospholipase A1 [Flavobacterium sp. PL002]